MQEFEKYNKVRINIESKFRGLPYAHALLANYLIAHANPIDGIVTGITYNDLALLLTINKAPGRKDSGTPTKQTIRNYIKSIERECGDHFKVISEGQSLQFYFPDMPKLFSNIENNTEVNTDLNQEKSNFPIENIEENWKWLDEPNIEVNTVLNTEVNTPNVSVKNNIFNSNNKQTETKQTTVGLNYPSSKNPINPNFYPSQETITTAQELGLDKVTDPNQIQAFINHNQKQGSKWADFNPVFIRWLEREATFTKNQQNSTGTRSNQNDSSANQKSSYDNTVAAIERKHQEYLAKERAKQKGTVIEGEFVGSMG